MTSVSGSLPTEASSLPTSAPIITPRPAATSTSGPRFEQVLAEIRAETDDAALLSRQRPKALPTAAPVLQTHVAAPPLLHTVTATSPAAAATITPAPAPSTTSGSAILSRAQAMLGTPYVWGGTSAQGLDCSAFVSKAWGIGRQTTETLPQHAHPISKDQLQAGDAMNLRMAADPDGDGHVRLFDRWADAGHTKMWVYEATPPAAVHHVINYDPRYQPLRLNA